MNRKVAAVAVIGVGLVAVVGVLEFSGRMSGKNATGWAAGSGSQTGGCAGSIAELPAEKPTDIQGGTILADLQPVLRPGPDDPWQDIIPGAYHIKLAPAAAENLDLGNGRLVTHLPDLDLALDALAINEARPVFEPIKRKAFPTEHLGLERIIQVTSRESLQALQDRLADDDRVEWIEPVVRMRALGTPNDPYFRYQWHLSTLDLPTAWDITDGSGAVVAVVDTGVSAGGNDGFSHLLSGHDFVAYDSDPSDEHGHGTHVAGTIAQATNNGRGVAGVAPGASILPVRVLDADGSGTDTAVSQGIIWAVDNGADIINMSLGSNSASSLIESACAYAEEAGVLVVAATGNDGFRNFVSYPAAFASTLAVGAVDLNAEVTDYSNQGPEIDVVAPGGDTTADQDGDGYGDGVLQETLYQGAWSYYFFQGTSMATPHVAGTAALLHAHGITGAADLRNALTETAEDLGTVGWDKSFGNGLISPVNALAWSDGGADEPAPLEILTPSWRPLSRGKVMISWLTAQPANSLVEGDNGYTRERQTYTNTHVLPARGRSGQTVVFTVTSATEAGLVGSAELEVQLP